MRQRSPESMGHASQSVLWVVVTTFPDADVAESVATGLVEQRLAACANIVPGVMSIYRWEGEIEREGEVMAVLKTTAAGYGPLRDRLAAMHPYDVPEILAFPVPEGSGAYRAWVAAEVRAP